MAPRHVEKLEQLFSGATNEDLEEADRGSVKLRAAGIFLYFLLIRSAGARQPFLLAGEGSRPLVYSQGGQRRVLLLHAAGMAVRLAASAVELGFSTPAARCQAKRCEALHCEAWGKKCFLQAGDTP